jgi:hypothetical protein
MSLKRKIDWKDPASATPTTSPVQYYYPNRPLLVPPDPKNPMNPSPDYLTGLEKSGRYFAEKKWNGDNTMIFTDSLELWNRQRSRLGYNTAVIREELERLPKGCLINAELMHNHTKTVKDTLIIHCIMVYKGEPLFGKTWADSRAIIEEFKYGEHVQLSELHTTGFFDLWKAADGEVIEGIVLKDPSGLLKFSMVPFGKMSKCEVPWMLKVRKPCKKYPF